MPTCKAWTQMLKVSCQISLKDCFILNQLHFVFQVYCQVRFLSILIFILYNQDASLHQVGGKGEVCYHNMAMAPDYGRMGHTEAGQGGKKGRSFIFGESIENN